MVQETTWGGGSLDNDDGGAYLTPEEIEQGLNDIDAHVSDEAWLWENEYRNFYVLKSAIFRDYFYRRGAYLLCDITPIMLLGTAPIRWGDLLMDGLLPALSLKDNDILIQLFVQLGQSYLVRGKTREARTTVQKALERLTTDTDRYDRALLAYLVMLRLETFKYTQEFNEALVERLLSYTRLEHNSLLSALVFQALCGVYSHHAQSQKALEFGMTSLGYWYQSKNRREIAKTLFMIEGAYRKIEMLNRAHEVMDLVRYYFDAAIGTQYEALIAYEQGVLNFYKGNYEGSVDWLNRARTAFRTDAESRQIAMTQTMLGFDYMCLERYNDARRELLHAKQMWVKLDNTFEVANVLCLIGDLELRTDHRQSACEALMQALELCQHIPPMKARDKLEEQIRALLDKAA